MYYAPDQRLAKAPVPYHAGNYWRHDSGIFYGITSIAMLSFDQDNRPARLIDVGAGDGRNVCPVLTSHSSGSELCVMAGPS